MPDWIVYVLLATTGIGLLSTAVGLALVAIAAYRACQTVVARLRYHRHGSRMRERLVQQIASRQVRWLECHTTACGHLQTPHHPDGTGALLCEHCATPASP